MSTTKRRSKSKTVNKNTILNRTIRWQLCQNFAKNLYWSNLKDEEIKEHIKTNFIIK